MHNKDTITFVSHAIPLGVTVCTSFFAIVLVVKYLRYTIAFTTVKDNKEHGFFIVTRVYKEGEGECIYCV